jgi:hypothetical protein
MAKKTGTSSAPPGASGYVAARARSAPRRASHLAPVPPFFTQNPNKLPLLHTCLATAPSAPRSLGKQLPPAPLPLPQPPDAPNAACSLGCRLHCHCFPHSIPHCRVCPPPSARACPLPLSRLASFVRCYVDARAEGTASWSQRWRRMPLPRPDGIRARLRHDLAPLVVLPHRSPSQRLLLPLPPWMPPPPHTVAAGTNPPPQASFL